MIIQLHLLLFLSTVHVTPLQYLCYVVIVLSILKNKQRNIICPFMPFIQSGKSLVGSPSFRMNCLPLQQNDYSRCKNSC